MRDGCEPMASELKRQRGEAGAGDGTLFAGRGAIEGAAGMGVPAGI